LTGSSIVTLARNAEDDRDSNDFFPTPWPKRRSSQANESGLLRLGDQLANSQAPEAEPPAQDADTPDRDADAPKQAVGAPKGRDRDAPVANESGLMSLGEEMARSRKGHTHRHASTTRSRRGRHLRQGLVIGLAVLLIVVLGGAGYTYYLTHGLHREKVGGLSSTLTGGQEGGTENILMVGSTSRCALKVQNPAYGLCSQGVNGVNSDVIMILHADPVHHRLALLSVPRDLFIPNARSTGANKVDAGLFQGSPSWWQRWRRTSGSRSNTPYPQFRSVRQHRRRPRWDQHAIPGLGVRRRIGLERAGSQVRAPRRDPGPAGGAGPPPAVRPQHPERVRRGLAPGEPERPGPHTPATTSSSGCLPLPWPSRGSVTRSATSI